MKKLLFAAAIVSLSATAFAGNTTVAVATAPLVITVVNATPPPAVLTSFRAHFGTVTVRQWKLRSNGQWRAHFLRNGIAWEATFTSTGALVKSEPA